MKENVLVVSKLRIYRPLIILMIEIHKGKLDFQCLFANQMDNI